ncbi:MAG: M1 family aminopeptidase [Moheibacter sp.]
MRNFLQLFFILTFSFVFSQNQTEGTQLDTAYKPIYYRLEMKLNPNQQAFSGTTTVHFNTTDELSLFKINARSNLNIQSISYHQNTISSYTRAGDVLNITLPEMLPSGKLDSISISFSGNSATSTGLTLGQHAGVPIIETIAQPWHASSWWVCKDDLIDKVTKLDVYVTHPNEFKAASNGLLKSVTPAENGMSVTHWQHNYAIPVYLIGIAVTNYAEYNNSVVINGTTVPIINYLYPETMSNWTDQLDQVPSHIQFLSEKFGDYPYKNEKYGHAQWNRNGGMEHSTMSFMGKFTFNLVVHELAHMWFGDKVTCATWHDIWLNEGFADYCTGLLTEYYDGEQSFQSWKSTRVQEITAQNGGSVYNPDAESESRTFNSRLTYKKGSMAAHLIRFMMNDDELYYQTLKNWLNDPEFAWGYADTEDLKAFLEAQTGNDWSNYFNDWIYGEGHPIFNILVDKTPNSNELTVRFSQTGSHSSVLFFHTPFEIEFRGSAGQKEIRRFEISAQQQNFEVNDLGFNVTSFVPNPKSDVICQIAGSVLSTDELNSESEIKIYPNPVQNLLNIVSDAQIRQIEITDLSGKTIYKKSKINLNQFEVQTRNFPKGIYIIQIKTGKKLQTKKFIKE